MSSKWPQFGPDFLVLGTAVAQGRLIQSDLKVVGAGRAESFTFGGSCPGRASIWPRFLDFGPRASQETVDFGIIWGQMAAVPCSSSSLAQLVGREAPDLEVPGSIPAAGTVVR